MVRNQAKVFLAGPPLLKAATGEIATDEELGGAEMHATVSGVAEWMAENDADGIRMAREVIAKWHWNDRLPPEAVRLQGRRSTTSTSCAAWCRRRTRIPTTCAR